MLWVAFMPGVDLASFSADCSFSQLVILEVYACITSFAFPLRLSVIWRPTFNLRLKLPFAPDCEFQSWLLWAFFPLWMILNLSHACHGHSLQSYTCLSFTIGSTKYCRRCDFGSCPTIRCELVGTSLLWCEGPVLLMFECGNRYLADVMVHLTSPTCALVVTIQEIPARLHLLLCSAPEILLDTAL